MTSRQRTRHLLHQTALRPESIITLSRILSGVDIAVYLSIPSPAYSKPLRMKVNERPLERTTAALTSYVMLITFKQ